jgi:hypothetical protein
MAEASMAGLNLVPFPRQTLLGGPVSDFEYPSEVYDLTGYRTVAWTLYTAGIMPGSVTFPATYFVETAADLQGPFTELNTGGTAPNSGTPANGSGDLPARFLRVRVVILQDEAATVEVRLVARTE